MARVRRSAADWVGLIEEWRGSGLSLDVFCARRGINAGTMSGWIYKRDRRCALEAARRATEGVAVAITASAPSFVPVRVAEVAVPPTAVGVEVVLAEGRRVVVGPGFDPETLLRVVAVLEGRAC